LTAGGIPAAEVTFRTAEGEEAIRRISREAPEILVGAGTVLTTVQVDRAVDAGAKFIVSPGFNQSVVAHCAARGIPITPGCSSPTDIERALEMGLDVVKFFPAEQSGGLEFIKAVGAPYPTVRFIPTGGINAGNVARYLAFDRVIACGGSWMVSAELINSGDFARISALSREAIMSMLGFSMHHVGINAENEESAGRAARMFETLFAFSSKDCERSFRSESGVEVMKGPFLGRCGHIAIATNSVFRARAYFERNGVAFNEESVRSDAKGGISSIYFRDEICGFAIHLVQR